MSAFRSDAEWARYERYKAEGGLDGVCRLCEKEPLKNFTRWRIIQNEFPYDKVAKVHHMIIPNRHVTEPELNSEEIQEFRDIKQEYLHKKYDFLIEASYLKKSIPGHFHIHLIVGKN